MPKPMKTVKKKIGKQKPETMKAMKVMKTMKMTSTEAKKVIQSTRKKQAAQAAPKPRSSRDRRLRPKVLRKQNRKQMRSVPLGVSGRVSKPTTATLT